ncbi:unnamed protein product [Discosporangium mesarthrocarpum]
MPSYGPNPRVGLGPGPGQGQTKARAQAQALGSPTLPRQSFTPDVISALDPDSVAKFEPVKSPTMPRHGSGSNLVAKVTVGGGSGAVAAAAATQMGSLVQPGPTLRRQSAPLMSSPQGSLSPMPPMPSRAITTAGQTQAPPPPLQQQQQQQHPTALGQSQSPAKTPVPVGPAPVGGGKLSRPARPPAPVGAAPVGGAIKVQSSTKPGPSQSQQQLGRGPITVAGGGGLTQGPPGVTGIGAASASRTTMPMAPATPSWSAPGVRMVGQGPQPQQQQIHRPQMQGHVGSAGRSLAPRASAVGQSQMMSPTRVPILNPQQQQQPQGIPQQMMAQAQQPQPRLQASGQPFMQSGSVGTVGGLSTTLPMQQGGVLRQQMLQPQLQQPQPRQMFFGPSTSPPPQSQGFTMGPGPRGAVIPRQQQPRGIQGTAPRQLSPRPMMVPGQQQQPQSITGMGMGPRPRPMIGAFPMQSPSGHAQQQPNQQQFGAIPPQQQQQQQQQIRSWVTQNSGPRPMAPQ